MPLILDAAAPYAGDLPADRPEASELIVYGKGA